MSSVLVTGGAGFIGSHLVEALVKDGYEVTVVDDLSFGSLDNLQDVLDESSLSFLKYDIVNECEKLHQALEGVDIILHLAAIADVRFCQANPKRAFEVNVNGTLNLLECLKALQHRPEKLIYFSSSTVYGEPSKLPTPETYPPNPISIYGVTKFTSESVISVYSKLMGFGSIVVRLANVVGSRSTRGLVVDLVNQLRRDSYKLRVLGDGRQKKSYIHVEDVVSATIKIINEVNDEGYRVYNVGSIDAIDVMSVIKVVCEELGLSMESMDVEFDNRFEGRGWPGDVRTMLLDVSKIEREVGWAPRLTSAEAVRKAVRHLKRCVRHDC